MHGLLGVELPLEEKLLMLKLECTKLLIFLCTILTIFFKVLMGDKYEFECKH